MSGIDDLPTDSVLRRHAITERNRAAGLPPTDAVLRRHHDQWMSVLLATPVTFPAAAPAKSAAAPAAARPAPAAAAARPAAAPAPAPAPTPTRAAAAPAPSSGGLLGWLRRLFGN